MFMFIFHGQQCTNKGSLGNQKNDEGAILQKHTGTAGTAGAAGTAGTAGAAVAPWLSTPTASTAASDKRAVSSVGRSTNAGRGAATAATGKFTTVGGAPASGAATVVAAEGNCSVWGRRPTTLKMASVSTRIVGR